MYVAVIVAVKKAVSGKRLPVHSVVLRCFMRPALLHVHTVDSSLPAALCTGLGCQHISS